MRKIVGFPSFVFLLCFVCLPVLAEDPRPVSPPDIRLMNGHTSVADSSRLARGARIRQLLLDLVEQADREGGWPDRMPANEGGAGLLYLGAPRLPAPQPGQDAGDAIASRMEVLSTTVVVQEPVAQHPDGVWVGYADGHIEFAATAQDLAACKQQVEIVRAAIARYGSPFHTETIHDMDPKEAAAHLERRLTLSIVDPDGRPAAGALVGERSFLGNQADRNARIAFLAPRQHAPISADREGRALVAASDFFAASGVGDRFLYGGAAPMVVLDEARGLIACEEVRPSEFDGRTRQIHLQHACKVIGAISSIGLGQAGVSPGSMYAWAFEPGRQGLRSLFSENAWPSFELLLPAGEYGIGMDAENCERTYRYIRIAPGQREYKLQIDLSPHLAPDSLIGQPAPELRQIKAWKNGGPIRMADLRGKVVVLDFWGYWCGPCIGSMPHLMALYDKYKEKGLVVIAVHDDSVKAIGEMDAKLEEPRRLVWAGRDLPFLIALDGGGQTRVAGTGRYTNGATNAAYRVDAYPTTLVIDRDGKVAGRIELFGEQERADAVKLIQRLLERPLVR